MVSYYDSSPRVADVRPLTVVAVVLNYERPDETIRCVRSLGPLEWLAGVVVVDNASGDDSVERLRRELPDVELVEAAENRGYTGGNNLGIARALELGARFVLVLNEDTEVVNPAFARELAGRLAARPRAGIAGPLVRYPDGTEQETVERYPSFREAARLALRRRAGRRGEPPADEREVDAINGVCLLLRRELIEDVGGFDEAFFMYGDEADLAWRARERGWKALYVPVASVVHHHPYGEQRGEAGLRSRANFVRFCLLHRGRVSAAATSALFLAAAAGRDLRRRRREELPKLASRLRGVWADSA